MDTHELPRMMSDDLDQKDENADEILKNGESRRYFWGELAKIVCQHCEETPRWSADAATEVSVFLTTFFTLCEAETLRRGDTVVSADDVCQAMEHPELTSCYSNIEANWEERLVNGWLDKQGGHEDARIKHARALLYKCMKESLETVDND